MVSSTPVLKYSVHSCWHFTMPCTIFVWILIRNVLKNILIISAHVFSRYVYRFNWFNKIQVNRWLTLFLAIKYKFFKIICRAIHCYNIFLYPTLKLTCQTKLQIIEVKQIRVYLIFVDASKLSGIISNEKY